MLKLNQLTNDWLPTVINAKIFRDKSGKIIAFAVENHGDEIVCAAVSMLVLNTVNSIEAFTKDLFSFDGDEEEGGFLSFSLENPSTRTSEVGVLLDAMYLGLKTAEEEYPDEIQVMEVRI